MKKNLSFQKLKLTLVIISIVSISASASAQWIRKANAFKFRSDLSESIVYNSKLYTFLGFGDHDRNTEPTSEVYDPVSDTYTLLAPIPESASMTHEKVVLIDNTIWFICGRVGQNPGPLTSATWIYNISTDSWSQGPQLTDPATKEPLLWGAGGAVLLGRTLHLIGGFVINACDNDQSQYHITLNVDSWLADQTKPANWKNELAPLPIKRNHFSTVVLGGKIYAIGGQFGHDCGGGLEEPFSHVYNPANDTWKELPLMPNVRSHAEGASFAIDGKIYIVGGQSDKGASTDKVTIFDPAANNGEGVWTDDLSLTLPTKLEGGTSKIINDLFIYSHGGEFTSANPRKKTYVRTIDRNPVYKLGFSSGCLKLSADAGTSAKGKTLLFTIDGSTSYTTSSSADWLTVTKNASGTTTPNAVDIKISANTDGLAPGKYYGTITATGTGDGPSYSKADYCVNLTVKSTGSVIQTLEAETAVLSGTQVATNHPDFMGTGFADFINLSGDYVEWTFNKAEAGSALLSFRYSNGKETDRPLQLEVNGVIVNPNLSFPTTDSWIDWATVTAAANLNAGTNTVRLTAIGYSGSNIDNLSFAVDNSASRPALVRNGMPVSSDLLKVNVSPNPASGNTRLVLSTASALPVEAELIDMLGKTYKKIKLYNTGSNSFNFSVSDMPSGMYIIKVKQGNTLRTSKLIVNNKTQNR
jgi:hypothetical protein